MRRVVIADDALLLRRGVSAVLATLDGIEVVATSLGPAFPGGLFVCQDDDQDGGVNQNFKLVPWRSIAVALDLAD